jgi:hypothetical protein
MDIVRASKGSRGAAACSLQGPIRLMMTRSAGSVLIKYLRAMA